MTEVEYLEFKNDLLKKKEIAESKLKTTTDEVESWVELSEKTFNLHTMRTFGLKMELMRTVKQ